ncbi:hypothetical protein V1521DRAFT_440052, partial [Lipomyces starkeyi]
MTKLVHLSVCISVSVCFHLSWTKRLSYLSVRLKITLFLSPESLLLLSMCKLPVLTRRLRLRRFNFTCGHMYTFTCYQYEECNTSLGFLQLLTHTASDHFAFELQLSQGLYAYSGSSSTLYRVSFIISETLYYRGDIVPIRLLYLLIRLNSRIIRHRVQHCQAHFRLISTSNARQSRT